MRALKYFLPSVILIVAAFFVLDHFKAPPPLPPTKHEFAADECIASTANIRIYHADRGEMKGYPVARVVVLLPDGYGVVIYDPETDIHAETVIPYEHEAVFQPVHCPEALGGDKE